MSKLQQTLGAMMANKSNADDGADSQERGGEPMKANDESVNERTDDIEVGATHMHPLSEDDDSVSSSVDDGGSENSEDGGLESNPRGLNFQAQPSDQSGKKKRGRKEGAGGGSGISGKVALALSLIAVCLSAYNLFAGGDTDNLRKEIEDIIDASARQNIRIDDLELKAVGAADQIVAYQSEMDTKYGPLVSQTNVLMGRLSAIQGQPEENQIRLNKVEASLSSAKSDIASLQSQIKKTSQRVAASRTTTSKPKITRHDEIEGARVVSIDRWGGDQYAVLQREGSGEYLSLKKGDDFKGWLLVSFADGVAVFKKGSVTRQVNIEG